MTKYPHLSHCFFLHILLTLTFYLEISLSGYIPQMTVFQVFMCVEEHYKDIRFHIVFTQHMCFQSFEMKFHLLKRKWKGCISKIKKFGL